MPLDQADLNELERSADMLQNYFHEVRATNEREFASQQQQLRRRHPDATNAQLENTPLPVHIQDSNSGLSLEYKYPDATNVHSENAPLPVYFMDTNSGLYLEYKPDDAYQVQIQKYDPGNVHQQWYVIQNNHFPEYYVIANSSAADPSTKVIAAHYSPAVPLYLVSMSMTGITRDQLWSFRQPDTTSTVNGKRYVITNAASGKVMTVYDASTAPGTRVVSNYRQNTPNQLFRPRG